MKALIVVLPPTMDLSMNSAGTKNQVITSVNPKSRMYVQTDTKVMCLRGRIICPKPVSTNNMRSTSQIPEKKDFSGLGKTADPQKSAQQRREP